VRERVPGRPIIVPSLHVWTCRDTQAAERDESSLVSIRGNKGEMAVGGIPIPVEHVPYGCALIVIACTSLNLNLSEISFGQTSSHTLRCRTIRFRKTGCLQLQPVASAA
jgi:hypothetical protein